MREQFFSIYQELTAAYSRIPGSRWLYLKRLGLGPDRGLRMVDEALHRVVDELELGNRLRPDARHFILVNMHQMVCLPILADASRPQRSSQGDFATDREVRSNLARDVEHDVRLILEAAANQPDYEVSGHAVLVAVSRVYDRLKTAASNVWG